MAKIERVDFYASSEMKREKLNELIDAVNSLQESVAKLLIAYPRILRDLNPSTELPDG